MSSDNGTLNGYARASNLQGWLVAANGLASVPPDPSDRELTDNEYALAMNIGTLRIDQGRRMLDPRRDVREASGVPRSMPDALAFLRLYQDDAVAGAVVERYPDETYKVPGEVWDGDSSPYGSGSVDDYEPGEDDDGEVKSLPGSTPGGGSGGTGDGIASEGGRKASVSTNAAPKTDETPFNAAWAELQAQMRHGGTESYYKGEEYSAFWKLMRDWDVASRVGRYGVLFVGLDDGKRLDQPAAGLEEEGSVSDYFEFDYKTNAGVGPDDPEYDDPNRVRDGGWADRGGRRIVFNTARKKTTVTNAKDRHGPWSVTWNKESKGAKQIKGSDKPLLYCRVFTEAHATPVRWERNRNSPRYQQPTMWHVDFGDPLNTGAVTGPSDTAQVHWTRILVLKSDARFNSNVLAGVPACWPVYPTIYNLQKYEAAAGEGYWTSGLPLRFLKTPPAIAGARTVVRTQTIRDQTERMMSALHDRFGIFENLEPGQLPATVIDPSKFEESSYKKLALALNMPMRKLIGDPQGAIAGAKEDTGDWDDVIRGRQNKRAIPEQVVPCVDRFILLGLLPEPQGGEFDCGWPAVDSLTAKDRADVASVTVTALATYVEKGVDAVMAPEDLYVELMGKTPEEARAMLDRAAEASEQRMADEMDRGIEQQKAMIDEGLAPDPAMEHDSAALDLAAKVRPSAAPTDKIKGNPAKPPTKNEADADDFWDFDNDASVYNKGGKTKLTGGSWVTLDNGVKVYLKSGKVVAGPRPVVEAMNKPDAKKPEPKKPDAPEPAKPSAKPAGVHRMTKAGGHDVGVDADNKIVHGPEHLLGKRLRPVAKETTPTDDVASREKARNRSSKAVDTLDRELRAGRRLADPPATTGPDAVKAIETYTGNGVFRDVNDALRSGKRLEDVPPPDIQHLQRLTRQNLKEPVVTYRGITTKVFNQHYANLKPGQEIEAKGFVSTSIKKKAAEGFTDQANTVLEIKAKRGLYVDDHSEYPGERELVQAHGTKYKMVGVVNKGGQKIVQLEEV